MDRPEGNLCVGLYYIEISKLRVDFSGPKSQNKPSVDWPWYIPAQIHPNYNIDTKKPACLTCTLHDRSCREI
jgi:hypothetical protein